MTPTEQDDELRKAVWASLASQMTHAINCTDPEHKRQDSCVDFTEKNFEQLMQLITADRKRVALESEMNAWKQVRKSYPKKQTLQGNAVSRLTLSDVDRKITELKAQQEEV